MKIDENTAIRRKRMDSAGKGAKTGGLIGLAVGAGIIALGVMLLSATLSSGVGVAILGFMGLGSVVSAGGITAAAGAVATWAVGILGATTLGGALIGGGIGAVNADTERAVDEAYAKAERMEERNLARSSRQKRTAMALQQQEIENERQASMLGLRPSFGGFEPPGQGSERGVG